jgi:hypothetical protein
MSKHELEFWVSRDSDALVVDLWSVKPRQWHDEASEGDVIYYTPNYDEAIEAAIETLCEMVGIEPATMVGDGECAKVTVRATVEISK